MRSRWRCFQHGRCDGLRITERDAANRGTAAAEKSSERARLLTSRDRLRQKRHERFPERLVQPIPKAAAQQIVTALDERRGDSARIRHARHCATPRDRVGQNLPRLGCGNLEVWNEKDEFQLRAHFTSKGLRPGSRHRETTERCRRGIVRMPFEARTYFKKLRGALLVPRQRIQPVQHSKPYRHTAAETPRLRDIARDFPIEVKGGNVRRGKKCSSRVAHDRRMHRRRCAPDGHTVRNVQGNAKAVEAWAEIRRRRWDASGHAVHRRNQSFASPVRSNVDCISHQSARIALRDAAPQAALSYTVPKPTEFVDHLLDLLKPLGDIRARSMFGGWGIYHGEKMFALVAFETFFVKTDDITRAEFESHGLQPFVYGTGDGKRTVMSYYTVPTDALESSPLLCDWARKGMDAAARASAKKGKPKAKRRPASDSGI